MRYCGSLKCREFLDQPWNCRLLWKSCAVCCVFRGLFSRPGVCSVAQCGPRIVAFTTWSVTHTSIVQGTIAGVFDLRVNPSPLPTAALSLCVCGCPGEVVSALLCCGRQPVARASAWPLQSVSFPHSSSHVSFSA
jgi:hypothetical protein